MLLENEHFGHKMKVFAEMALYLGFNIPSVRYFVTFEKNDTVSLHLD